MGSCSLYISTVSTFLNIRASYQSASSGFRLLALVVQKVDNAIHRISHYPLDSAIGFSINYPLGSDLSGG